MKFCTSGSKAFNQSKPFFTTRLPFTSLAAQLGFAATIAPPLLEKEEEKPYSNQACTFIPARRPSSIISCNGSLPAKFGLIRTPVRFCMIVLG